VSGRERARGHWAVVGTATAARRTLADRAGLVTIVALYLLVTAVIATVWRAAADESPTGLVAGYSAAALAWYLAASEIATMAVAPRLIEIVGEDIADGAVESEMLRPAPVVGVRLATGLGSALPRIACCALAGAGLSLATVGAPPDATGLALAVPALVLGVACNLACQHAAAAAAFWLRDAKSAWFLYQKFLFMLGGMLLPLEVLPGWLERIAVVLPFAAMAYVPGRLASGHVEPGLLLLQAGWLVVLTALAAVAFARGERRLQAVGA
jgi:ABC-2 type transport system permease protein